MLSWKVGFFGGALLLFGFMIAGRFARYCFTHLDWLIFESFGE